MLRLVAPVTLHASVLDAPLAIEAGVAVKLAITGTLAAAATVTVALAVTDPAELVAVRV